MKPYFSVVIPVKNGESVISESIETLLNQTDKNFEIIVVNDHSADKTRSVVVGFKDERIKIFDLPKDKTGISSGRHFGNEKALGDIIIIADADDWNYPDRLKKTREYFEIHPEVGVFYGNVDLYYEDTGLIERRWFQPFNSELIKHINFIPNPASAYKKDLYFSVAGYDSEFKMSEDYDLWLQFLKEGASFGYIEDPLVKMRRGSHSIRIKRSEELKNFINLVRKKHGLVVSRDLVNKLAQPDVYKFFTSPEKKSIWF